MGWTRGAFTVRLRAGIGAVAIAGLLAGACSSGAEPPQQSATSSEARLDDAEAALARAEAAAAAARAEAGAARAEAETARAEAQAAQVELEQAEEAAGGMRLANATAQSRVEQAEEAVAAAQAEVESAQVEADEARAAADAMRAEAEAARSEVEQAEAAAAAARAEVGAAQAVAGSALVEADEARARAEQANAEAGAAEDAAAAARAVTASANAEAQEAETAAELAEEAAAAAQAEAALALERATAAEAVAAAQAEAAEAALAALEQSAASSTTTSAAATTPSTTSAATSPDGPSADVATEDMSGDYEMAADDMADDGGSGGSPSAASTRGSPSAAAAPGSPQLRPPSGCPDCSGNTFEDYGVNPFVSTDEDPLSTFALDVDTASFVVARNFLRGGTLPPPEAVRVEEFVNYFDGGYEPVPDEFVIDTEVVPSPFASDGHVLLRVGVRAPDVLADVAAPQSIVVVMDRSGSMGAAAGYRGELLQRIELAHQAVELLLGGLPDGTRVGIVSYDDQVATVVEPTDVAGNRDWIIRRVRDEVTPRGSTNAEAGLLRGYEMALAEAEAGWSVLVMLLSDGVANVGATRTDEILAEIGDRGDIGLTTIGVGLGPFNDALMEQLANTADGTYHYIDSFGEARRIFVDNLASLLSVAARDAKIQVVFNPDTVRSYRLLGFENRDVADEDFRDNTVDAGEVGLGQSSTALYELELAAPGSGSGSSTTLATVTLRYERPRRGSVIEVEMSIGETDVAPSFAAAGEHFRLAAVVAEFAEVLRGSPFSDGTDAGMSALAAEAAAVAEAFSGDPDATELVTLIETARQASGAGAADG